MIELGDVDRFPVFNVVARLTFRAQAPFVLILVARDAARGETEISAAQVLGFDRRAFLRRDVRGIVALVAGQSSVLAFEKISSLLVVKGLDVPLDDGEVFAVMLGMTARAFLTGAWRKVVARVQPSVCREPSCNFGVAFQTFQGRLPAKLVATGAVCGSVERLVRAGEGAGRNLSGGHSRKCG